MRGLEQTHVTESRVEPLGITGPIGGWVRGRGPNTIRLRSPRSLPGGFEWQLRGSSGARVGPILQDRISMDRPASCRYHRAYGPDVDYESSASARKTARDSIVLWVYS